MKRQKEGKNETLRVSLCQRHARRQRYERESKKGQH